MTELTTLTERDIRHLAGRAFAGRGDIYQRERRLYHCRRTDEQLFGYCRGNRPLPYEVFIFLEDEKIRGARCNCPVGGWCKHTAALLFEWVRRPDAFAEAASIHQKLSRCSREDLIEIIDQTLDRHPELSEFVDLWASTSHPASLRESYEEHVDRAEILYRAEKYLSQYTGEPWDRGAAVDLKAKFNNLILRGRRYAETRRLSDAAAVYAAILEALRQHYENYDDSGQELRDILVDATRRLTDVFRQFIDPFPRSRLLPDLWETWLFDNYFGNLGMMKPIEGALSESGFPSEKQAILSLLQDYTALLEEDPFGSDWERRQALRFALLLQRDVLPEEIHLERARRLGDLDYLIPVLLESGRVDEAVEEVLGTPGYGLERFAELFVDAGYPSRAIELMQAVAQKRVLHTQRPYAEWLTDFFIHHRRPREALQYARAVFEARPTVQYFLTLRQLARELGFWEDIEEDIIDELYRQAPEELLEVHLHDGNNAVALALWSEIAEDYRPSSDIALRLADALRTTHPNMSAEIWAAAAEELIAARGRSNYRTACQYLAEIRDVYLQLGHLPRWNDLARWFLDRHDNLPAFKDEMHKAGLTPDERGGAKQTRFPNAP